MFTIMGSDGKEYGPVTVGNVIEWMRDGRANLQTRVKLDRDQEWKTLGDFAEFGGTAGTAPAVMPPRIAAPMAPALESYSANRSLRFLAALVDGILKTLCYLPITIPLSRLLVSQAQTGEQPSFAEMSRLVTTVFDANLGQALPLFALLLLVQLGLLVRRGQSVGKLLAGLRIVRQSDDSPAGFLHAFLLRGTVPFLIEQVPVLGLLFWTVDSCFIFRDDRRCLHDLLADTKVVAA